MDLYLSGDLNKEEYRNKKTEYENEISRLESVLAKSENNICEYDPEDALKDVCNYLKEILSGDAQDEIFYKNLVEKIVVHSRERIDVYLNLLPHKWSVVLNSVLEQDNLCGSISSTTYRRWNVHCATRRQHRNERRHRQTRLPVCRALSDLCDRSRDDRKSHRFQSRKFQ